MDRTFFGTGAIDPLTPIEMARILRHHKDIIIEVFDGARPRKPETKKSQECDPILKTWTVKESVIPACEIIATSCGIDSPDLLKEVCLEGKLIYALRTTAHVLKHMWSHDEVITKKNAPLVKCGELVLATLRAHRKGWNAAAAALPFATLNIHPPFTLRPLVKGARSTTSFLHKQND